MVELNLPAISLVVGLVLANITALIGAYVKLRVGMSVLEVKVGLLETDIRNLANMIREQRKEKEK